MLSGWQFLLFRAVGIGLDGWLDGRKLREWKGLSLHAWRALIVVAWARSR
ncbi:hypothetical protein [Synechococcus sp. MIT S9503]